MKSSSATDLDILVRKGYSESNARDALKISGGNLQQALLILRDGDRRDTSWMKETLDQWVDNVPSSALPTSAESRALWKSPVYVRVGSWKRVQESNSSGGSIYFVMTVIMRDSRSWNVQRTYLEFYSFWVSLPFGTGSNFKNAFPQPGLFEFFAQSDEQIENKRIKLEEWMRELCLNEECMMSTKVISLLYEFLKEEEHGGDRSTNQISSGKTHISEMTKSSPFNNEINSRRQSFLSLRKLTIIPVSMAAITKLLPCHVRLLDLPGIDRCLTPLPSSTGGTKKSKDSSTEQLIRDLERDRVIINGKRMLGSQSGLEAILDVAIDICDQIVRTNNICPQRMSTEGKQMSSLMRSHLRSFCRIALQQASRTESAFLSHSGLAIALDLLNCPDLMVVPESSLAFPLSLTFCASNGNEDINALATDAISSKSMSDSRGIASAGPVPSSSPSKEMTRSTGIGASLTCDIEASTVYRISNVDTMQTLLQLRVTYCRRLVDPQQLLSSAVDIESDLELIHLSRIIEQANESAFLVFQRETTTTSRDWNVS